MATLNIPTSDLSGMNIESFDTTTFLEHASAQARQRHLENYFIVDVDSHHYENASHRDIVNYVEDPVLRQRAKASMTRQSGGGGLFPTTYGSQDMSGRVTRYHTRYMEKVPDGHPRDLTLAQRWMDAMGVDISMLFPTPMLDLGAHPCRKWKTSGRGRITAGCANRSYRTIRAYAQCSTCRSTIPKRATGWSKTSRTIRACRAS